MGILGGTARAEHCAGMLGSCRESAFVELRGQYRERDKAVPGHRGVGEVLQVMRGLQNVLSRKITCSYLHFIKITFSFLIIKLIIFLVENFESSAMHLYTYIHPKAYNIYNKKGRYLYVYMCFLTFLSNEVSIFPIS